MVNKLEKQNIPEGWQIKSLGDFGGTLGGLSGKTKNDFGNGSKYIPYMNVFKNSHINPDFTDLVRLEEGEKQNNVLEGDYIFTVSSETPKEVGMSSVINKNLGEIYLNSFCFIYRQNQGLLDSNFGGYLFRGSDFRKKVSKQAKGSTRFNLSKSDFLKIEILFPESKKEQQKIAEVLGAVDAEIEQTKSVIKATEKLKKGLMRQLFTRGIGHTKFKHTELGEIPEEWEVKKLGDIAKVSTGTTPSTNKPSYYNGTNPFIKTGEIVNERITRTDVYISDQAIQDCRLKKFQPGTILMAMYGQGKTRGQTALLDIEACTTQNAAAIEPVKEIDTQYLWLFLKSQYEMLRGGGVQGQISHMNLSYVKSYFIPVPTLKEQQKMAKILLTFDEKVSVNKKLLTKQTELKKGLMQDLLSGVKRIIV